MTLKPRQEWLLRAVVEEFIASGSPVGSRRLSQTSRLGVAPSTIRNDLSVLEDEGLLDHPADAVVKGVQVRVLDEKGAVKATQSVSL